MHIDEWLNERIMTQINDDEKYAVAFFFLVGMSAVDTWTIAPIMKHHKLFCTYLDKVYRVTGSSTMGDIWLHSDYSKDSGYELRVDIEECSSFSPDEYIIDTKRNRPDEKFTVYDASLDLLKLTDSQRDGIRQLLLDNGMKIFEEEPGDFIEQCEEYNFLIYDEPDWTLSRAPENELDTVVTYKKFKKLLKENE